jgi:hypothetical protein
VFVWGRPPDPRVPWLCAEHIHPAFWMLSESPQGHVQRSILLAERRSQGRALCLSGGRPPDPRVPWLRSKYIHPAVESQVRELFGPTTRCSA